MDSRLVEKIERLAREDRRLLKLYEEHKDLDRKLLKLGKKTFQTPDEELMEKTLKRKKLAGKDRIMQLLENYEQSAKKRE